MTTPTITSGTGAWTPGPWGVASSEAAGRGISYYVGSTAVHNRSQIAHVRVLYDDPHNAERNANSRLIAAAPELYEALDRLLSRHGNYINELPGATGVSDLAFAKTALAKVEGRNP
jgi:hypothetical protein